MTIYDFYKILAKVNIKKARKNDLKALLLNGSLCDIDVDFDENGVPYIIICERNISLLDSEEASSEE